ncbi:pseudouridine synthase [Thelephora ganbajun]|uniref:Pseudouridine synthase n=1 Tax=Thelephora ganbajun TaxID=370292 RepID=A0ACB6ZQD3_THEGA|nr:pseudouridine synthase [Thelephora ganbajun]
MTTESTGPTTRSYLTPTGLRKIEPYWYPYTTMAKGRWLGREMLEVVSTEFRDRSIDYYRYALESGVTTVNGKIAKPNTIIRNGDRIENVVHRHEPPVTDKPVKIIHHDAEGEFIVIDKPGSIPVHAAGRYFRHTLVEILKNEFGYEKIYTVNRLDRLTSGLMILGLSNETASELSAEFREGNIKKEYIARCKGEFPVEEITCDQPLLTVDRQMGLNIVHPDGKPATTIFQRIRYDLDTDTSVLHCRPLTGRSHQIRVHLQYLGHPIANDQVYSETRIWGENLGKGGVDLTPNDERSAPLPPSELPASSDRLTRPDTGSQVNGGKLLPRETGHDIGMGSPVPLSKEAVEVITRLRNLKDEDEDWSRWRDVIFKAKGALAPRDIKIKATPPQNRRKRGGPAVTEESEIPSITTKTEPQLTDEEVVARMNDHGATGGTSESDGNGHQYCPECYLPLHPDPKPEKLYIFLHALRYTTSLGSFKTEMPEWAAEGWIWNRD